MRAATVTFSTLVAAAFTAAAPSQTVQLPAELPRLDQPVYGQRIEALPAQRIAMLETNQSMDPADPLVAEAAALLTRLTAMYVEDAPRIAELTVGTALALRAANRPSSPLEIIDGALRWERPGGNRPREYERYIAAYRALRIKGKLEHAQTLAKLKIPPPPAPPATPAPARN